MNIAIDGYEANIANRVGIGSYAFEILKGIHTILPKKDFVTVYIPDPPLHDLPKENEQWAYEVRSPKKLWTFFGLPLALTVRSRKPDVVFSPTHYAPRFVTVPRVISIMDLSYLYYPELFRPKDLHQLVHWTKYSVLHARAICTISEFSRNAILNAYTISKDKVFVTYPGFRIPMYSPIDVRKQYSLEKPYLLSVGTLQPRKNFSKLIESFSLLKKQPSYADYELVIVGKKGWMYEDILASPQRYGVKDSVKFLDFVPDEHLPDLYKQSACFVLVSLYEGFGLPALEAMSYGIPTVVSNTSSLPEIVGTSGVLVDPASSESIMKGIDQTLKEKKTEKGKKRIADGIQRAALFSWESAAEKTLDIIEKVGRGDI